MTRAVADWLMSSDATVDCAEATDNQRQDPVGRVDRSATCRIPKLAYGLFSAMKNRQILFRKQ